MVKILNPEIYQEAKKIANKVYKKPSAYKSGFIIKKYKELGGTYQDDGNPKNLKRWMSEKWTDVAGLDYPVYRPTVKVNEETPLLVNEIDSKNLVEQSILKQKIKGKSNLPPFEKKKVGGKRSAKEVKDFLDASYKKNPPQNIDGWILDKELSRDTAKVYYNPETKEAVVAHRGTKGALDWGNNVAYTLGYYEMTPRYKKGKSVQDSAEKKYGKDNISTLGHSQGAILSRKLGADTKEIINVNPAWMGEKPKKNEYNVRSSSDIVSGLYAPVSKVNSILFPTYTQKHDITIPSKSKTDIIGEHSYDVLDRIGNQEIGIGAENKISTNNIMKGGRQISLDEKIKQLMYIGMPQQAVELLLHTGNLETVFNAWVSGDDIKPVLNQLLDSLEPVYTPRSIFDLNVRGSISAPQEELKLVESIKKNSPEPIESSEPIEGGSRVAYMNIGTNPYGVRGGKKGIIKKLKSAGEKMAQGISKGSEYVNPMMWAIKDKNVRGAMATSGQITNDYLLPAVVSAGKPIYDATAMTASTMLTGNPVLGKAVADTLWNEMVAKKGFDPRENQKSKELGQLSATFGQAMSKPYSASLQGKGKTIDFEEMRWGTFERMFHDFKRENPRARVKDLEAFAKRIIKNKSKFSKRAFQKANFYLNVIKGKDDSLVGGARDRNADIQTLDWIFDRLGGYFRGYLQMSEKQIKASFIHIRDNVLPLLSDSDMFDDDWVKRQVVKFNTLHWK